MVLVNCGATEYVRGVLPDPDALRHVRFVVIDAHRPVHPTYNDAADADTVLVLADDDPQAVAGVPHANPELDAQDLEGEFDLFEVCLIDLKERECVCVSVPPFRTTHSHKKNQKTKTTNNRAGAQRRGGGRRRRRRRRRRQRRRR